MYWNHPVLHRGVQMTFQDLVDEWTSSVWAAVTDPDIGTTLESGAPYGLDVRRKIEKAIVEIREGGEPVGVVEEVAVADLLFEPMTREAKPVDFRPPAVEQLTDSGQANQGLFHPHPLIDLNHGIHESEWNTPVQLGSRSVTFRQTVRAWAAEVWLICEAQSPLRNNPRDWTLHDFVGALSFRSILFRAQQRLRADTGHDTIIPSVDLTDRLFYSITQPDTQGMLRAATLSTVPEEPFGEQWWWGRIPSSGPILEEFLAVMQRIRSEQ